MLARRKKNSRSAMVATQLRPNKVTDPTIISAFSQVFREDFLPEELEYLAYSDAHISLKTSEGYERFLLPPWILARLFEIASIQPSQKLLMVGCATGYSLAIASYLTPYAHGLEEVDEWVKKIEKESFSITKGPLTEGIKGDFDTIIIEGAVERIPMQYMSMLSKTGQLICIVKEKSYGLGTVTVCTHNDQKTYFDIGCHYLNPFAPKAGFVF